MLQSLPGFREFYPEQCAIKSHIFKIWRQTVLAFGFLEFEAPLLEPLELFTEKSGPEIVEQLFHFVDKGGRAVALRPELTPSLVRMVGAKAQALRKPIKWFNIGEQFRFERPQKGRLRSFYQLNIDCLGVASFEADAELISLLIALFRAFGLTSADFKIRLSDRTLWFNFLESKGLSYEAAVEVLGIIDKLEREETSKTEASLAKFFGSEASSFLKEAQSLTQARTLEALRAALGQSATQEAVSRRLAEWEGLLSILQAMGLAEFVHIDLGIVRGLAYYTGFVFEAFQTNGGRALAGGGRYDQLVERLGGPALPAVGFAIGDVTLTDLLVAKNLLPFTLPGPEFFLVSTGSLAHNALLSDIQHIRSAGLHADYMLQPSALGKQLKLADQLGARFVLLYAEDELSKGIIKLKNLSLRTETEIPREHLVAALLESR